MSEQRAMMAETLERLFRDAAPTVAAVADGWNEPLWRRIGEMGIPLLLAPEDVGGVGGDWDDALAVVEAVGRAQVALPVAEQLLAGWLLARAGRSAPDGVTTIAPRLDGALERTAEGWRFSGVARHVPWGRHAVTVLAGLEAEGTPCLILLPPSAATVAEGVNLAGEPRDTLRWTGCPVEVVEGMEDALRLPAYGALLRAGQMAGALAAALERSVGYVQERQQFGKPIGKFQAVQQQLALLGGETAALACAVRAAFRAADRGFPAFEIAAAKLRANMAADLGASIAHQVHGAIGFTREYDLRHATQRLWSWRSEFGNDRYWSEWLGGAVAARGADAFWPDLTARADRAADAS